MHSKFKKIIKKLLILSITILSLISCSSNDDNLDPIIGTWYKFSEEGIESSDCEKKTTVTFNENSNFKSISYESIDNECIKEDEYSSNWKNKGSGVYSTGTGNEATDATVSFSDSNNTLTSVFTEEHQGKTYTDITVYKRK